MEKGPEYAVGQAGAVNQRSVRRRIAKNSVTVSHQGRDEPEVGGVPGREHERLFHSPPSPPVALRARCGAGRVPFSRRLPVTPVPYLATASMAPFFTLWVGRQSQVVVGTEHDDLGPCIGDGRADLARQLTVERVEAELLGRPVVVELGT